MKRLLIKFKCWFYGHKWTSAAMKGEGITPEQIKAGYKGLKDYATMYCDRCGFISKLSDRL